MQQGFPGGSYRFHHFIVRDQVLLLGFSLSFYTCLLFTQPYLFLTIKLREIVKMGDSVRERGIWVSLALEHEVVSSEVLQGIVGI